MWTKSQKVSAGVLGVAVIAFVVDRCVLDGGSAAQESAESIVVVTHTTTTSAPAAPVAAPAAPVAAAAVTPGHTGVPLAARLAAMAESRRFREDAVGDAFRPSEAWLAAAQPPAPVAANVKAGAAPAAQLPAPAPKPNPAVEFQRTHMLTAVMKGPEGGMAIVNGRLYKPGQFVDGFKLTKVGLREARFWGQGKGVTLKLPGQTVADAR